jgi:hypothetical protein
VASAPILSTGSSFPPIKLNTALTAGADAFNPVRSTAGAPVRVLNDRGGDSTAGGGRPMILSTDPAVRLSTARVGSGVTPEKPG